MKISNTRLKKLENAVQHADYGRIVYVSLHGGVYHLGDYNGEEISQAEFDELENAPGVQVILAEYVDRKVD